MLPDSVCCCLPWACWTPQSETRSSPLPVAASPSLCPSQGPAGFLGRGPPSTPLCGGPAVVSQGKTCAPHTSLWGRAGLSGYLHQVTGEKEDTGQSFLAGKKEQPQRAGTWPCRHYPAQGRCRPPALPGTRPPCAASCSAPLHIVGVPVSVSCGGLS